METTTQLYEAINENILLDLTSKVLYFERFEDIEDGIFNRVCDWTRFANKIDKTFGMSFLNSIAKTNKLKIKCEGFTILRDVNYTNECIIEFDEAINSLVANAGEKQIIEPVKKISVYFSYEWYLMKNGRQNKIANGIEFFFEIKTILQ